MIAGAAAERPPVAGLAAWLRFDEARIPGVEQAYTTFLERAKFGWWLAAAVVLSFVVAIAFGFTHAGEARSRMIAQMLPWCIGTFYGVQVLPLLLVPRDAFVTMLRGCVDVRRAILLGMALGFAAAALELALFALLSKTTLKRPAPVDLFANGVVFGMVVLLAAAPIVEEFQMQAWLQSRLRPLGGTWAGILTTIVFVAMHVPKTVYELTRVATLGMVAVLRGSTRSLAACIALHFTNNAIFFGILVLGMHAFHRAHTLAPGSHR